MPLINNSDDFFTGLAPIQAANGKVKMLRLSKAERKKMKLQYYEAKQQELQAKIQMMNLQSSDSDNESDHHSEE